MLIDKAEIYKYRQISKSVRDDKINPHIEDAEFLDLRPLLGELLYHDIVKTPTDPKYTKLLDPHTYTYEDNEYQHLGLKRVLSLYSYARYILMGTFTDTGFGFVQKKTQDSDSVAETSRRSIYKKDQDAAFKYFSEISLFLDRNSDDYHLWNSGCETNRGGFKINKITIDENNDPDLRGRGITDVYHG